MKKLIVIIVFLSISLLTFSQNAKEILQKSFAKCQTVKNGYYEMTKYMKFMSNKDTNFSSFNCTFKKLKNDSLYSSAFHYTYYFQGEYSGDVMYTGEDFITYSTADSSGEIMSKSKWAEDIKSYSHNYTFYSPFTSKKSSPLPSTKDYTDNKHIFKFISEVKLNNITCYNIQMNEIPENDSADEMKEIRNEYHYWINKEDFIPIQYTIAVDIIMNNDTMYQYEKFVLTKYDLNNLKNAIVLQLNSIPSYCKLKNYEPYKLPELLPNDTFAPNWSLSSLTEQNISLTDLKGQIVLIDFFYKSCAPCMKALPALQDLNERYKDKGLKVIGIDPYDKKEDDVGSFLSKRGVTYTILLGGKDVAKDYHVAAYPTIYLIDKTGKIIFTQMGYGKGVEGSLEEIIKKNL